MSEQTVEEQVDRWLGNLVSNVRQRHSSMESRKAAYAVTRERILELIAKATGATET